ncbi:MAG: M81 family metallopeptidase [Proteobacteria bacterium]|nr:M81 family metallopeptidase [Pseudomonadota bacterium]
MAKRVAILGFHLESNAFSPVTTEADYRKRCYVEGEAIIAELGKANSRLPAEVGGFVDDMDGSGVDWKMVPILIADAEPGGPVDQAFFERTLAVMRARLVDAGTLDGVYIDSHGAMRATGDIDPDGTIYAMVRSVVGPDLPVIATLDLHANVSTRMVELTDVLVAYLTNPHVDQRERAAEAAQAMRRLWSGEKTFASFVKVPIAAPTVTLLTAEGPYADLIRYGQSKVGGAILNVSVTAGFIYSDSAKCGMSVIVTSLADAAPGRALANDIAARAWADRQRFKKALTPIADIVKKAKAAGEDPSLPASIIADVADNPGGGGSGNTTYLLKALTDAGAAGVVLGLMIDPAVAARAHALGVGGRFDADFNADPKTAFDTPLTLPVIVEKLTDGKFVGRRGLLAGRGIELGPCALLRIDGVRIGVASNRKQCADPVMLEQFGIDIGEARTVVVKSRGHFRAGFDEYFSPDRVIEADCPGLTSPVLKNFPWDGLCRPVYPLDEDAVWSGPAG